MKNESIGALWINEGQKGEFLAGKITIDGVTTSIVVFKNNYKNADSHPDYRIFLSNKQEKKIPQQTKDEEELKSTLKELEPF